MQRRARFEGKIKTKTKMKSEKGHTDTESADTTPHNIIARNMRATPTPTPRPTPRAVWAQKLTHSKLTP